MSHGIKLSNSYQRAFGDLYAKTPKAVFAAVAYSYASAGGDYPEKATENAMTMNIYHLLLNLIVSLAMWAGAVALVLNAMGVL